MAEALKPPPDSSWVCRAADKAERHECQPPVRAESHTGPPVPATGYRATCTEYGAEGDRGDLWRCRCGQLWRVVYACRACESRGEHWPHGGQCTVGNRWRPATWWQRMRHWRRGDG